MLPPISPSRPAGLEGLLAEFASALTVDTAGAQRAREETVAARGAAGEKARMEASFRAFIPQAWNVADPEHRFVQTWHADAIADHAQALVEGKLGRYLVILQPPGTGKSLFSSVLLPAWLWGPGNRPGARVVALSYAGKETAPAVRDGVRCRHLLESFWYQANWGDRVQFSADQNAKTYYTFARGGSRFSGGMESATGHRADLLIIDDPVNKTDRFSKAAHQANRDAWTYTIRDTMADERSVALLVMQRVAVGDFAEFFMTLPGVTVLRLPLLYEPKHRCQTFMRGYDRPFFTDPRTVENEPLYRDAPGMPLLAERLADRETQPWAFASDQQQRPSPLEGGMVKLAWIQRWHQAGACGAGVCKACRPDVWDAMIQSWDMAFKDKETGSWVVGQVWGRLNGRAYLLDQARGHWDLPSTMAQLVAMTEKWPRATLKLVEDKANGPAVIQMLGGTVPGLVPVQVEGNKVARLAAVSPFFQSGNVFVPPDEVAPWMPQWVAELTTFPQGDNDQADATSQALANLLVGIGRPGEFAALNADVPLAPVQAPAAAAEETKPAYREGSGDRNGHGPFGGFGGGSGPVDMTSILRLFR